MIELLKMCGYEENKLASELPRIKKVFSKLGITEEDIDRGKKRLVTYYDIEFKGVQKLFRLYLKELCNIMLSEEEREKIIYWCMSPGVDVIGTVLVSGNGKIYMAEATPPFFVVLGCIFDKIVPILEAAEKQWLKSGLVSHCGMVKTMLGVLSLDLVPKPDLLITAGFLCDTSPKVHDLIHELYNEPVYYCDHVTIENIP